MQFINYSIDGKNSAETSWKNESTGAKNEFNKVKVGILGTGKIGTDLLIKIIRSDYLECVVFAGRNKDSVGMKHAASLGIAVSDEGINAFYRPEFYCDVVFDATTAAYHLQHDKIFKALGIFVIDMTPSQIGECCVPALGLQEINKNRNISMISCGGQAAIPLAHVITKNLSQIEHIEVISTVSPLSIGPGTWANIEEYRANTLAGLKKYTGLSCYKIQLLVDDLHPEMKMRTSVIVRTTKLHLESKSIHQLQSALKTIVTKMNTYVPGYVLEAISLDEPGIVKIDVSIEGVGDFLPPYAGNLDIINCAAIAAAESYAQSLMSELGSSEHAALLRFTSMHAELNPNVNLSTS